MQNLQQRPKGRKKVSQGQIKINHCSLSTDFLARTRAEKKFDLSAHLTQLMFIQNFFSSKNGKDFNPMAFIGLYWPLKSSLFLAALKIHKLLKILLILIKTWIKSHRKKLFDNSIISIVMINQLHLWPLLAWTLRLIRSHWNIDKSNLVWH